VTIVAGISTFGVAVKAMIAALSIMTVIGTSATVMVSLLAARVMAMVAVAVAMVAGEGDCVDTSVDAVAMAPNPWVLSLW